MSQRFYEIVGGSVFKNCLSGGLSSEENVDLLLDPVLVVGGVGVGALLVHETRQVCKLVDEIKQLKNKNKNGYDQVQSSLHWLVLDFLWAKFVH